jgi:hypothetical protein
MTIKLDIIVVKPKYFVQKFASVGYTKILSYANVGTKMGNTYLVVASYSPSMPPSTKIVRRLKFRQVTCPFHCLSRNRVVNP